MLHVAFGKLPSGGAKDMRPRLLRPSEGQCHAVLQLVAEPIGAACLVEGRARPDAAGERLVEQPAVQHDVHRPVRRPDLHGLQERLPMYGYIGENRIEIGGAVAGDQCAGPLGRSGLAEEGDDLDAFTSLQLDYALQRSTRIKPRADLCAERQFPRKRRGPCGTAVASEEFHAVGGPCGLPAAEIGKGDAARKVHAPSIAGEDRPRRGVEGRGDKWRTCTPQGAEHPLGIARDRQPARARRMVGQRQPRNADRIGERHIGEQLAFDPVRKVAEAAVAEAMTRHITSLVPDRLGRRAPEVERLLVADVKRLAGRVADRVVGPLRDLVLAAVLGPAIGAAVTRHLKTEGGIGDDVDPGHGSGRPVFQHGHVFRAVLAEAAEAVEEFEIVRLRDHLGGRPCRRSLRQRKSRMAGTDG